METPRKYVYGTTNSWVLFPSNMMPSNNYTFMAIARYLPASRNYIFAGADVSYAIGFHSGKSGVAYHGINLSGGLSGWITDPSDMHGDDWVLLTDQQNLFRSNCTPRTTASGTTALVQVMPSRISINAGAAVPNDMRSTFAVMAVLAYNRKLSESEITSMENWLCDRYMMPIRPVVDLDARTLRNSSPVNYEMRHKIDWADTGMHGVVTSSGATLYNSPTLRSLYPVASNYNVPVCSVEFNRADSQFAWLHEGSTDAALSLCNERGFTLFMVAAFGDGNVPANASWERLFDFHQGGPDTKNVIFSRRMTTNKMAFRFIDGLGSTETPLDVIFDRNFHVYTLVFHREQPGTTRARVRIFKDNADAPVLNQAYTTAMGDRLLTHKWIGKSAFWETSPSTNAFFDGRIARLLWYEGALPDYMITRIRNDLTSFITDPSGIINDTWYLDTDPGIVRYTSDHVCIIRSAINTTLLQAHYDRALVLAEEVYSFWFGSIPHVPGLWSTCINAAEWADPEDPKEPRYKLSIYYTDGPLPKGSKAPFAGSNPYSGYAFMSSTENAQKAFLALIGIANSAMNLDLGNGPALMHEFGHCLHMHQKGWNNGGHGPWWEPFAEWCAQAFRANVRYDMSIPGDRIYNQNMLMCNTRSQYSDYMIFQYIYSNPDKLPNSKDAFRLFLQRPPRTFYTEAALLLGVSPQDFIGLYARRAARMDIDWYSTRPNKRNDYENYFINDNQRMNRLHFELQASWDRVGDVVDGVVGKWYFSPRHYAPQICGLNCYEIVPSGASGVVRAYLDGICDSRVGSDWRMALVAQDTASNAFRYSDLVGNNQFVSIPFASRTERFFIVVAGTPQTRVITALHGFYAENVFPSTGVERARHPYEVQIWGADVLSRQGSNILRYAYPPATSGYVRHANGGGWKATSATVSSTAYIGPSAVVMGTSTITDNARIEGCAMVLSATVRENAVISGHAIINSSAVVAGYARVSGNAWVSANGTVIDGNALVTENVGVNGAKCGESAVIKGQASTNCTLAGSACMDGDATISNLTITKGHCFGNNNNNVTTSPTIINALPDNGMKHIMCSLMNSAVFRDKCGVNHGWIRGSPMPREPLGYRFDGSSNYILLDKSISQAARCSLNLVFKPVFSVPGQTKQAIMTLGSPSCYVTLLAYSNGTLGLLMVKNGLSNEVPFYDMPPLSLYVGLWHACFSWDRELSIGCKVSAGSIGYTESSATLFRLLAPGNKQVRYDSNKGTLCLNSGDYVVFKQANSTIASRLILMDAMTSLVLQCNNYSGTVRMEKESAGEGDCAFTISTQTGNQVTVGNITDAYSSTYLTKITNLVSGKKYCLSSLNGAMKFQVDRLGSNGIYLLETSHDTTTKTGNGWIRFVAASGGVMMTMNAGKEYLTVDASSGFVTKRSIDRGYVYANDIYNRWDVYRIGNTNNVAVRNISHNNGNAFMMRSMNKTTRVFEANDPEYRTMGKWTLLTDTDAIPSVVVTPATRYLTYDATNDKFIVQGSVSGTVFTMESLYGIEHPNGAFYNTPVSAVGSVGTSEFDASSCVPEVGYTSLNCIGRSYQDSMPKLQGNLVYFDVDRLSAI